ncbi:MAG TPA: PaaI family thioesterase [Methanocorpusculum sp.]|nr:PaaI family thioesterase [Methanocorpusculum sp.]
MHPYIEKIEKSGQKANNTFVTLGITPVSWGGGKAVLKMTVSEKNHNGAGFLQGGFYVVLADEAIALALCTLLEENQGCTTVNENTSFIKGAHDCDIYAVATILRKGRRIAYTEAEVHEGSPDGLLLSKTSATYLILEK